MTSCWVDNIRQCFWRKDVTNVAPKTDFDRHGCNVEFDVTIWDAHWTTAVRLISETQFSTKLQNVALPILEAMCSGTMKGGSLVVVAPFEQLKRLDSSQWRTHAKAADSGFLDYWMAGVPLCSEDFFSRMLEFAQPAAGDRWPSNHPGCGRPKDGAWLLTESELWKAAVKLRGLPAAQFDLPLVGSRHETALEVSEFLHESIVLCKSDSGSVHIFVRREGNLCIMRIGGSGGVMESHVEAHFETCSSVGHNLDSDTDASTDAGPDCSSGEEATV